MTGGGGFDFFCRVWVGTIPLTEGSSAAGRANCANDRQLSYCWLGLVNRFQLMGGQSVALDGIHWEAAKQLCFPYWAVSSRLYRGR